MSVKGNPFHTIFSTLNFKFIWIEPIELVSIVIFSSVVELLFTLVTVSVVSEVIHDYYSQQEQQIELTLVIHPYRQFNLLM